MSVPLILLVAVIFLTASAFFVFAEYVIVSARRSKWESEAKKGKRSAKLILEALDQQADYVAGIQTAITLIGIGMGSVLEPSITKMIDPLLAKLVPDFGVRIISVLLVSFPLVVIGELVPKYLALQFGDRFASMLIGPLRLVIRILSPFVWALRVSSSAILRLLRIPTDTGNKTMSREELSLLVQASSDDGQFSENHSDAVSKALRLDQLDAADVMSHRLDVRWIDVDAPKAELLEAIAAIPHSRIPVAKKDIDDVVGVLYVHDLFKHLNQETISISELMRQPVFVPENLTLDRCVQLMQDNKSQVLIVRDEYGGTSGLLTLEDVVEEVFGDMEDTLESERPSIEQTSSKRLSARADTRYDELIDFLDMETGEPLDTRTLAQLLVDELERTPKLGDSIDLAIGKVRVEQVVRQRVVRVGIYLSKSATAEN